MFIDIIAGARPNFMKIAPIIDAIHDVASQGENITFRLVHTGQHYDKTMSGDFFEQLGIPEPDINLGAGSGTQAEQTASIMIGYEKLLTEKAPDLCIVVGDVTSTMACAITAQKARIPVAHIEAGIRSGDWSMPEEINRLVTDSVTNYFFTTSETANENILRLGISQDQIFFVGNTMIDSLLKHRSRFVKPKYWEEYKLESGKYIVMTLHRPANVDNATKLQELLTVIMNESHQIPVIFPAHPRTSKMLNHLKITHPGLHVIEPLAYLEFNYLVEKAMAVITDSGGITEETTVMGVPCITLRDSTERPETVIIGTNELVGTNPAMIKKALEKLLAGDWKKGSIPILWDGNSAKRIVKILLALDKRDIQR